MINYILICSFRIGLLHTLATLDEHPESVPVNALVAIDGTPIAEVNLQKLIPIVLYD